VSHVNAPWTVGQVRSLNDYQRSGLMHPFTCPNRGDGQHRTTSDLGVLSATTDGWMCPNCDYTQSWAHDFMADGSLIGCDVHNFGRFDSACTCPSVS